MSNSQPSLTYQVIDTKEYTQAAPMLTDGTRRPDYNSIMTTHNICDWVDNKGVREVWLWAYQGPTYPGSASPYLAISESKMASTFGDISNSPRYNDMPICKNTYRVYTFNYGRGTAEAMESWGHQMEAEISAVNSSLFRTLWQGPNYPQKLGVTGRCGSVHNPPNARSEYDRDNTTPQSSDCLDWNPDGLGTISSISCENWSPGCLHKGDGDNPSLNYMVWNWQNLPGRNNIKTYQGKPLRNWWDIHGNFDVVMGLERTLTLPSQDPTPTPLATKVVVSDTFDRTDNSTSLGATNTGQPWLVIRGTWGITSNTAYPANGCPAPGYAVVDSGSADGVLELAATINPQDTRIPFRLIDQDNLYWVERKGGNPAPYELDKKVGGVQSLLGSSYGVTAADGDRIKITLSGPLINVYINDKLAISATDSAITSTKHGIGTWCGGNVRFDNFSFATFITPSPTPQSTPSPTLFPSPSAAPVADTIAPSVEITNPVSGTVIKKNFPISISASASDNVAVKKVEFYIDNILQCSTVATPYVCSWKVPVKNKVTYTIEAKAYDVSSNSASSTVTVRSK